MTIKSGHFLTDYIESKIGVKQGDNLSPTIFNIFLNDLEFPLDSVDPVMLNELPISHLLWADDLLILSESPVGLQKSLDHLDSYCTQWQLKINCNKSNIMVVSKSRQTETYDFKLGEEHIELTNTYTYLGCVISSNGKFKNARDDLCSKANKAFYKLYKSFQMVNPKADVYSRLFDSLVKPIILYSSEIWGFDFLRRLKKFDIDKLFELCENDRIEKLHNKFCKFNLMVSNNSINIACKPELGRYH